MKNTPFTFSAISIFLLMCLSACAPSTTTNTNEILNQTNMNLSSPNFENNGLIPPDFTCQGTDISPELNISGVPSRAVSLALIMEDPDAPSGTWTHWVMWNIPPETTTIPKNVGKDFAVQGNNSWPKKGYGGPCPPTGTHRYFFKIYALSTELNLPETANREDLLKAIEGVIIDQDQYMGIYRKTGAQK